MAKKIVFEAFKYQLLQACMRECLVLSNDEKEIWLNLLDTLSFEYEAGVLSIVNANGDCLEKIPLKKNSEFKFYMRGDSEKFVENAKSFKRFELQNMNFFQQVAKRVLRSLEEKCLDA